MSRSQKSRWKSVHDRFPAHVEEARNGDGQVTRGYHLLEFRIAAELLRIGPYHSVEEYWTPKDWQLLLVVSEYMSALLEFLDWFWPDLGWDHHKQAIVLAKRLLHPRGLQQYPHVAIDPQLRAAWAAFTYCFWHGTGHLPTAAPAGANPQLYTAAREWLTKVVGDKGFEEDGQIASSLQQWIQAMLPRLRDAFPSLAVDWSRWPEVAWPDADCGCRAVEKRGAVKRQQEEEYAVRWPLRVTQGRPKFNHMKLEARDGFTVGIPPVKNPPALGYLPVSDVMCAFKQAAQQWPSVHASSPAHGAQQEVVQSFVQNVLRETRGPLAPGIAHEQYRYLGYVACCVLGWQWALQHIGTIVRQCGAGGPQTLLLQGQPLPASALAAPSGFPNFAAGPMQQQQQQPGPAQLLSQAQVQQSQQQQQQQQPGPAQLLSQAQVQQSQQQQQQQALGLGAGLQLGGGGAGGLMGLGQEGLGLATGLGALGMGLGGLGGGAGYGQLGGVQGPGLGAMQQQPQQQQQQQYGMWGEQGLAAGPGLHQQMMLAAVGPGDGPGFGAAAAQQQQQLLQQRLQQLQQQEQQAQAQLQHCQLQQQQLQQQQQQGYAPQSALASAGSGPVLPHPTRTRPSPFMPAGGAGAAMQLPAQQQQQGQPGAGVYGLYQPQAQPQDARDLPTPAPQQQQYQQQQQLNAEHARDGPHLPGQHAQGHTGQGQQGQGHQGQGQQGQGHPGQGQPGQGQQPESQPHNAGRAGQQQPGQGGDDGLGAPMSLAGLDSMKDLIDGLPSHTEFSWSTLVDMAATGTGAARGAGGPEQAQAGAQAQAQQGAGDPGAHAPGAAPQLLMPHPQHAQHAPQQQQQQAGGMHVLRPPPLRLDAGPGGGSWPLGAPAPHHAGLLQGQHSHQPAGGGGLPSPSAHQAFDAAMPYGDLPYIVPGGLSYNRSADAPVHVQHSPTGRAGSPSFQAIVTTGSLPPLPTNTSLGLGLTLVNSIGSMLSDGPGTDGSDALSLRYQRRSHGEVFTLSPGTTTTDSGPMCAPSPAPSTAPDTSTSNSGMTAGGEGAAGGGGGAAVARAVAAGSAFTAPAGVVAAAAAASDAPGASGAAAAQQPADGEAEAAPPPPPSDPRPRPGARRSSETGAAAAGAAAGAAAVRERPVTRSRRMSESPSAGEGAAAPAATSSGEGDAGGGRARSGTARPAAGRRTRQDVAAAAAAAAADEGLAPAPGSIAERSAKRPNAQHLAGAERVESLRTFLTDEQIGLASHTVAAADAAAADANGPRAMRNLRPLPAGRMPALQPGTPASDAAAAAAGPAAGDTAAAATAAAAATEGVLGAAGAQAAEAEGPAAQPAYSVLSLRDHPDVAAGVDLGPPDQPGPSFRAQEMGFGEAKALRQKLGRELLALVRGFAQQAEQEAGAAAGEGGGDGVAPGQAAAAAEVHRRAAALLEQGAPADYAEAAEEGEGVQVDAGAAAAGGPPAPRGPLHWACVRGDAALVELLLRHGADPGVGPGAAAAAGRPRLACPDPSFQAAYDQVAARVQPLLDARPSAHSFKWLNLQRGTSEAPYVAAPSTRAAAGGGAAAAGGAAGGEEPAAEGGAAAGGRTVDEATALAAAAGWELPAAGNSTYEYYSPGAEGREQAGGEAGSAPQQHHHQAGGEMLVDGAADAPYLVQQYRSLLQLLGFAGAQLQLLLDGLAEVRRGGADSGHRGGSPGGAAAPLPVRVTMRAAGGRSAEQLRDMVLERYHQPGVAEAVEDGSVAGRSMMGGWALAPHYTDQQLALRRKVEHAYVRGWQVRPNGQVPVFLDAHRLYIRDACGAFVHVPVAPGRSLGTREGYRWYEALDPAMAHNRTCLFLRGLPLCGAGGRDAQAAAAAAAQQEQEPGGSIGDVEMKEEAGAEADKAAGGGAGGGVDAAEDEAYLVGQLVPELLQLLGMAQGAVLEVSRMCLPPPPGAGPPPAPGLLPVVRLRFATEALRKHAHARLTNEDMTDAEPLAAGAGGGAGAGAGAGFLPCCARASDPRVMEALAARGWADWTVHHALTPAQLQYVYDTHGMLRRVAQAVEADPARRGVLRAYRRSGGRVWLQGRGEGCAMLDARAPAPAAAGGEATHGSASAPHSTSWGTSVPLFDPQFSLEHFLKDRERARQRLGGFGARGGGASGGRAGARGGGGGGRAAAGVAAHARGHSRFAGAAAAATTAGGPAHRGAVAPTTAGPGAGGAAAPATGAPAGEAVGDLGQQLVDLLHRVDAVVQQLSSQDPQGTSALLQNALRGTRFLGLVSGAAGQPAHAPPDASMPQQQPHPQSHPGHNPQQQQQQHPQHALHAQQQQHPVQQLFGTYAPHPGFTAHAPGGGAALGAGADPRVAGPGGAEGRDAHALQGWQALRPPLPGQQQQGAGPWAPPQQQPTPHLGGGGYGPGVYGSDARPVLHPVLAYAQQQQHQPQPGSYPSFGPHGPLPGQQLQGQGGHPGGQGPVGQAPAQQPGEWPGWAPNLQLTAAPLFMHGDRNLEG